MLIVEIWCLPEYSSEEKLDKLETAIYEAVISVAESKIKRIFCIFPDVTIASKSKGIIIKATHHSGKIMDREDRAQIAESIGCAVKKAFPETIVVCNVAKIDSEDGYYCSS